MLPLTVWHWITFKHHEVKQDTLSSLIWRNQEDSMQDYLLVKFYSTERRQNNSGPGKLKEEEVFDLCMKEKAFPGSL